MIWSTWRQHRPEALACLAGLAAAAAAILYADASVGLLRTNTDLVQDIRLALMAAPLLVGVFVGAPLVARDLEQGTHRLVWTQGTTRSRWLRVKLLLVFSVVAAAAALLAGLLTAALFSTPEHVDRWYWFDFLAPAFVAYVVFALWLGIALGAVIGRTYPAMAATLVLFVVARAVVEGILRPRYLPPLSIRIVDFGTIDIPRGMSADWPVGYAYYDAHGHPMSLDDILALMNRDRVSIPTPNLAAHGLSGWAYFQPDARFWLFQGIETAIFLGLAALLAGLAYHWLARRVT